MIDFFNSEKEFHEQRQKTVGSSDIPTLLGLNAKYGQTPFTLWQEKTGRKESFKGNQFTEWGHRLEPVILSKFVENLTGLKIDANQFLKDRMANENSSISYYQGHMIQLLSNTVGKSDSYPWAIAHADLWIPELGRIQEAKSGSHFGTQRKDDPDAGYSRENFTSNGIPLSVYVQTIWQMLCYGAELCGVSALIDTSNYLEYGAWQRDTKLEGKLLEIADKFMYCVNKDVPPMPTTWEDYQSMFPRVNDTACVYPLEYELNQDGITLKDMIEVYHIESEKLDKAEEKIKDIKKAIGILMGENKTLQTPDGQVLVTMSHVVDKETPKGIKEIEKQFPDIAEKLRQNGLVSKSSYKTPKIRKVKE